MKLSVGLVVVTLAPLSAGFVPQQRAKPFLERRLPELQTATIESSSTEESSSLAAGAEGEFNWFKAWYPVVPVEILDVEKPHKFQLLGEDIVVWNDGKSGDFGPKKKKKKREKGATSKKGGTWRAFVDECPHRKVPLSEGRVEDDGSLLCSYHAWRFDGSGDCIAVPQIDDENELMRVRNNPKTACNSFPTKVVDGVLYVWASTDKDAVLESELTPINQNYKVADGVPEDRVWKGTWNYRELPYGADYFLENVVDSAHVSVSHHNVVGSRYGDQTMSIATENGLSKDGFKIRVSNAVNELNSTTTFKAPGAVHIEAPINTDGAVQVLELLVSPSRPGFSNHIGRMVIVKDKTGEMPKLLRQFTLPMPKWLNHILASAFLHQDALFLHHQERKLHESGQYSTVGSLFKSKTIDDNDDNDENHYTKSIYPVRTDKGVLHYRNWLAKFARGKIPYKLRNPVMPPADNSVVFDVWNGHTKHCQYCQTALRRLKKFRLAAFFVASCLAVLRPVGKIGSLAATLGVTGVGLLLHKLIGMFYKYEFSHAQND